MTTRKPQSAKRSRSGKRKQVRTIVEEVDKFEDLAPRMLELLETEPPETRIYLRVRKDLSIN